MRVIPLILRALAALVLAGSIIYWLAAGAHRGWSTRQIPVPLTDGVTGTAPVEYANRHVPGIDLVAAGLGVAAVIFAASFLFRRSPHSSLKPNP